MRQKNDLLEKGDKRNLNRAREYALRLLAYRERSEREIREIMVRMKYDDSLIKSTLNSLKSHNLVNDRRFARMWAESCLRRGYGRWKVHADLNNKGIDKEVVEEVLRES